MRRTRTAHKSGNMVNVPEGEQGFWPSYTDMMSSFALILFFLMLIAYLSNIITGNHLLDTEKKLQATEDSLQETLIQIDAKKAELDQLSLDLEATRQRNTEQEEKLKETSALLEEKQAQLNSQQQQIEDQKEYISLTTNELTKLRSQMQTVAALRLEVVEKIRDSIATSLGDASAVTINDSGNIVLNEGLLFSTGEARIKPDSYATLNKIASGFAQFLRDPNNAKYTESITISGHADSTGSDDINRALSAERANSVLAYLLSANGGELNPYAKYFCAAGYSNTRPIADNSTSEGRAKNRRIEISVVLKDDSMQTIIDEYLDQPIPETQG